MEFEVKYIYILQVEREVLLRINGIIFITADAQSTRFYLLLLARSERRTLVWSRVERIERCLFDVGISLAPNSGLFVFQR